MAARFPEDTSVSEDFLNCLICTEPYENPKVLPCHHTFCTGCLDRYFETVQQEGTQEPGTLPCPVCRRVVNVPTAGVQGLNQDGNLPSHRPPATPEPFNDLVQKIEKTPMKKVHCDVCKYRKVEILAKDHCASCGINYCEQCSRDHSKHCLFRNHSVVPVTQMEKSSLRCETHEAETVKYYCFTCMVPLCTVCAVSEHHKHETAELHAALGNKKETVVNGISSMSERVAKLEEFLCELEDLQCLKDASMKKTKLEIDRHVNNLIGQLHMRKHAIMEELDKLHNASMKQIAIEKESVAFQLANMKSLWKFGAKLCEPSQNLQLLAMHTDIMIMIESTRNKPAPQIPNDCALMNMFMPRPDLSIGSFQKCELTADVVAKAPGLTNGHQNGENLPTASPRIPKSSSLSSLSRPMSAPPTFFKDPFKEQPSLKWLVSPKLCWKVNKVGSKTGEICETYDVTILPGGCTVVAEWMNQRLQLFDENGQSVGILGAGSIQPWGVTVTREGNLAVTDDKDRSVKIMDPTGRIITSWRKNMFGWPRGLAENTLGQYVVSDTEHGKHTVSIHLPDGRCVRKFGSQGSGNNQFHWPRYVCVDHDDRIIVSDGSNHCVKVFDPSGQFMFKFGGIGTADGNLKHPRGICVDPQNNIIIADQDNNRVTLYSPDGKFLRHLLAISKPWGVYVSDSGLMAVTQKPALKIFRIFDPVKC